MLLEAEKALENCLTMNRSLFGENAVSVNTAGALNNLGAVYKEQGKLDEANSR